MTKNGTCKAWVYQSCPNTATSCIYAHHFFPIIVNRAHKNPIKAIPCSYGSQCQWPRSRCGFQHAADAMDSEWEQKLNEAERNLPWETHVTIACKACGQEVGSVDMIVKHMQEKHPGKWDGVGADGSVLGAEGSSALRSGSGAESDSALKIVGDAVASPDRPKNIMAEPSWRKTDSQIKQLPEQT